MNSTPSSNGVNQIYTDVTPWCCISKRNALTLIHCPQLRPFANRDNLKKLLTPFKITLPLHRFIWTSKRIVPQRRLVAIQRKVRDDLHDSLCSGQQVLSKLRCCFPDFLCETELNQTSECRWECVNCTTLKLMNDVTHWKSYCRKTYL